MYLQETVLDFDARYLRGIDHFNRREFFEAHEVWEDLWIEINDERKGFYHGLIQAAVTLHHALRNNYGGARSLYVRMRNNLESYGLVYEGLNVAAFLVSMELACASPLEGKPIDPRLIPLIALDDR